MYTELVITVSNSASSASLWSSVTDCSTEANSFTAVEKPVYTKSVGRWTGTSPWWSKMSWENLYLLSTFKKSLWIFIITITIIIIIKSY